MKSKPRTKKQRERGIALVIVLAFVVLLTGLVVAYFARTITDRQLSDNSFNQAAADQLANSALSILIGDLKQELAASGSASTLNGTTIYANPEVMPVRNIKKVGSTYVPLSLLRISTTASLTTGTAGIVDQLASNNALSTGTSANGRSISPARWNKAYLIPRAASPFATTVDSTPSTAYFNPATSMNVPSWIYVTGTGPASPALTSPTNSVVGRYAYMVYDEGSLLDINSAGYPDLATSATAPYMASGTTAALYSQKGALAFADLTVPGLTGAAPQLTKGTINALVGWRNFATLSNASGGALGIFPSFTPNTAGANGFYTAITTSTTGFMSVSGSATATGLSDQAFLTRQQLISLMIQGIGTSTGNSIASMQNALQNLGTFSRAVTSPSWAPAADAGSLPNAAPANAGVTGTANTNYNYKSNSETNLFPNRDMANVRFPNAAPYINGASVTHYYDDGSTSQYTVRTGDPSVQHRFSLTRIDWLAHTGINTAKYPKVTTQTVTDCFGLQWGKDAYQNPCWFYVHGSKPNKTTAGTSGGVTIANKILTLDQVAALNPAREPDFFELLKAAILNGSLGRDPGSDYTNFTNQPHKGVGGTSFNNLFSVADEQIIQIGVNIIDQYHVDSYPTAIFFQGVNIDNTTVPEAGPLNVFYGIKNLPYINKIQCYFWDINGFSNSQYNGFNAWYQPELWNPFQVPAVSGTTNRPTHFSLQAYGIVQMGKFTGGATLYATPTTQMDYDTTPASSEAAIYFKDPLSVSGTSYVSDFANPLVVGADHNDTAVGTTPTINIALGTGTAVTQTQYGLKYNQSYSAFLGIHAGYTPFGIIPYNGVPSGDPQGRSQYGYPPLPSTPAPAPPDTTHTWVVDSNADYYGNAQHTDNNFQPHVTPYLGAKVPPIQTKGVTFCLKYWDGTQWLPYSYISRMVMGGGSTFYPTDTWSIVPPTTALSSSDPVLGSVGPASPPFMHVDPLTDRFSGNTTDGSHYHWSTLNTTWEWQGPPQSTVLGGGTPPGTGQYNAPQPCPGSFYYDYVGYSGNGQSTSGVPDWTDGGGSIGLFYGAWAQNIPMAGSVNDAYYADPDGIVRPGNDCCWNVSKAITYTSTMTDGLSQLPSAYATTGSGAVNTHTMGRRPLILNRPFRSVGELGYVYRDDPFKTLDFFTAYSADAGLLDVFSVSDQPTVVAGQINPNNAAAPVLQAILSGAAKQEALTASGSPYNLSATAEAAATGANTLPAMITNYLAQSGTAGALGNRSDLVTKLGVRFDSGQYVGGQFQGNGILQTATNSVILQGFASSVNTSGDQTDKTYLEAPIRALADVTNTRTWNLMIDVIAQTGVFPQNTGDLNKNFVVKGERRYWLHIAIDRFTGKVVDEQLEPVYE